MKILIGVLFFVYLVFRFCKLSSRSGGEVTAETYYRWNLPVMVAAYGIVAAVAFFDFVSQVDYFLGLQQAISLVVFVVGVALSSGAKQSLGQFHQAKIVIFHNHVLVDTGLYRFLRHPYLVGVFLEVFSITIFFGSMKGFLAFIILYVPLLWLRSRLEDKSLKRYFGMEFEEYRKRVPPFVPLLK